MDREIASDTPTVVAVVVAHDPGPWFAETLAALSAQDYPNLRVLVVDAASRDPVGSEVAAALPEAVVHRLDGNWGFGAAANEVLSLPGIAADAQFLLFCHDDVAPAPGATQAMVDVARATGAGIVGPKLVDWDDPRRLLQLGDLVDRAGVALPVVECGELDQGQHDATREVFGVPGGFSLVRADLFAHLGGFDEAISFLADDLSLCWRARLAGARVVTAPDARVRHREALADRLPERRRGRLLARHRLRVVLTSYQPRSLLRILPPLLLWSTGMLAVALLTLRVARVRTVVGAWGWNLWRVRSLRAARRQVRRFRQVGDGDLRELQVPGLVHPLLLVQRTGLGSGPRRRAVRDRIDAWGARWSRGAVAVLLAVTAVLALGSRHLVTRGVPAIGELAPFGRPADLLDQWLSTWRATGLGADAAAPTALGVLGAVGRLLGGHDGMVRALVTVGLIPLGLVGMARLARPMASRWAPVAATVAYAAVPVPYAALADGRWAPLAVYAAAPSLLGGLARAGGAAPFAQPPARRTARCVLTVGIAGGLLGLVVPAAPLVVALLAGGLALGSLFAMDARGAVRVAGAGGGGALLAAALHLPWALDAARAWPAVGAWSGGARGPAEIEVATLLGLGGGVLPVAPWSWGLLGAAAVPLLVGRSWRASWAVRAWVLAIAGWTLAAMAGSGWSHFLPEPAVFLACAGAALALAVGVGVAAIERDVAGRSRRFGLRRSVVVLGGVGLLAGTLPVLGASLDGYWLMPRAGFSEVLGFVDQPDGGGGAPRVLWLGDPEALPVPGRALDAPDATIAFAVTDGLPSIGDRWPRPDQRSTERVAQAARLAITGQTARLGRLLAPMAVDYVVVPQRRAPSPLSSRAWPAPAALVEGLSGQLDLERVPVDRSILVFRNLAALPERSTWHDPAALHAATPTELLRAGAALDGGAPVLGRGDGYARWTGAVAAGHIVVQAVDGSDRWVLEVDGVRASSRTAAFGWANAFDAGPGGRAVLRHETPASYSLVLAAQGALWSAAIAAAVRLRRRAGVAAGGAVEQPRTAAGRGSPRTLRVRVRARRGATTTSWPRTVIHPTAEIDGPPERPVVVETVRLIRTTTVDSDTGGNG